MSKTQTSILLDTDVYQALRLQHANVSKLCNDFLRSFVGLKGDEAKVLNEARAKKLYEKAQSQAIKYQSAYESIVKKREAVDGKRVYLDDMKK